MHSRVYAASEYITCAADHKVWSNKCNHILTHSLTHILSFTY